MRITLRNVAEAAEVSVSTASRALSGDPSISAKSAARVRDAAARLSYPVRSTRRSVSGERVLKDKAIAVVSLGMDQSLLSLPAVGAAINGAEAELSQSGARVMLAHVPDLEHSPANLQVKDLAGVILAGTSQGNRISAHQSRLLTRLRELPSVWVLGRPLGCWGDAVGSNDYLAGQRAASYLYERGHRRVAFLNPKPEHLLFNRREDGFLSQCRRLGLTARTYDRAPPEGWPSPDRPAMTTDAVQNLVEELLATQPRPTALFAAADSVAVVVYRALAARRLRVGRDISIISANNDVSLIAGLFPHLTTFEIHAEQIGRMSVKQLARRLAEPNCPADTELLLEPTLVEGDSVQTFRNGNGRS